MATFRDEKSFGDQNPHKKPFQQPTHKDPREGGQTGQRDSGNKPQQGNKQPQKPEKGHW